MKSVLIVAYYFPPIAASGSMRPLGFCRYLETYGWRPRVLTTDADSVYPAMGVDESLCDRLPDSIQIDRVPSTNPEQRLLQIRNKFRAEVSRFFPSAGSQAPTGANGHVSDGAQTGFRERYLNLKNVVLDWLFSFPDPQCFWLRPAVQWLSRIPIDEYPDVVFATGGPWTGLLVGQALARRFRVPFVADFRDPWTYNPYLEVRSPFLFHKAAQLERSVYKTAACVVANTPELCSKLRTDHPDLEKKFVTITNGFDTDTYNPVDNACNAGQGAHAASSPVVELCHFGSVYGNRNPAALLQAVKELIDRNRIGRKQLRIRFVGAWEVKDASCEALARDLEQLGVIRREAPVSHAECVRQMRAAEILLILQPASPLQIPGKIYEYVATGRPLLVIGGEGATAQLVNQHRLGICCPDRTAEIKDLIQRLVAGQTRIAPPRREDRDRFAYRTLAGDLASVLDSVCATN